MLSFIYDNADPIEVPTPLIPLPIEFRVLAAVLKIESLVSETHVLALFHVSFTPVEIELAVLDAHVVVAFHALDAALPIFLPAPINPPSFLLPSSLNVALMSIVPSSLVLAFP